MDGVEEEKKAGLNWLRIVSARGWQMRDRSI